MGLPTARAFNCTQATVCIPRGIANWFQAVASPMFNSSPRSRFSSLEVFNYSLLLTIDPTSDHQKKDLLLRRHGPEDNPQTR